MNSLVFPVFQVDPCPYLLSHLHQMWKTKNTLEDKNKHCIYNDDY